jgi:hypothetical protein
MSSGKEELLADVGVVQSVAYLRGLEQLFAAELLGGAAQSLRPGAPVRFQQNGPSSRIASVAPGDRVQLAEFPGETITKLLPYESTAGGRFLLLLSKDQGRVIRFNPATRSQVTVVEGLQSPDSMVFDENSGNLLVADGSQIRVFSRASVEVGLEVPAVTAGLAAPAQSEEGGGFGGIAVDLCTGNIVVSDRELAAVVTFDRDTGDRQILAEGFVEPDELLALYRIGTDCPEAFHLLVSDRGAGGVRLLSPGLQLDLEWLGDRPAEDLTFLPQGNPITQDAAILFAELPTTTLEGAVSTFGTAGVRTLYSDRPGNPPARPWGGRYGDPQQDTFGSGEPVDALGLHAELDEVEAVVFLLVSGTTEPGVHLAGFVDLDIDQDVKTGTTSHVDQFSTVATGLGVEFTIDLSSWDPESLTASLLGWTDTQYEEVGRVPLTVEFDPPGLEGTTLIEVRIPVALLGGASGFDFVAVVGSPEEVSDIVPNRGFLRAGVGP